MTRRIAIRTKAGVNFYELKKNDRPITIIGQRLYRTDEKYMLANSTSPEEFCLYDLDSTYPYCADPPSPDETMTYIDIVKASGQRAGKVSSWPKWLNRKLIPYAVIGVVILWYVMNHYL